MTVDLHRIGNHELFSLYIAFQYRFDMPAAESSSDEGNLFYSFNYGPIHVIALDSLSLFFWHSLDQYKWLKNDLEKVNRTETPWIFVHWHYPWYCSNVKHQGSGDSMRDSYEDLLYKHKVDISFVGHVHAYERTKPVYKVRCPSCTRSHQLG